MIYTVYTFWEKKFFKKPVLNRFAMLHIFYKQLRLGDSTESCLWLWVNFYHKGCLILVV